MAKMSKALAPGAVPLALPKKKSVPASHLADYTMLIYGREKIGKTTLAAQFPDALFLMFEPGGRALEIYQMDILTWVDFKKVLGLLKEDSTYRTVVVDTVDLCYRMCLAHVRKTELGGNHPADEAYGKGWDAIKDEFQRVLADLFKLGKGVIFLSHETEKEVKLWKGGTYDMIAPTMSGVARGVVEPMVDVFGYYYYGSDDQRYLKIVGDSQSLGGARIKEAGFFKDVDQIPMGESAAEGYTNLCLAFENKLKLDMSMAKENRPQTKKRVLPKRKGKRK